MKWVPLLLTSILLTVVWPDAAAFFPRPDVLRLSLARSCDAEPRPIEFYEALAATVSPSTPAAATPAGRPRPAGAATVAAVEATVRELVACLNAGDRLRLAALYTEANFARRFALRGPFGGSDADQILADLASVPTPRPQPDRAVVEAVGDVIVWPDGRVDATLSLFDPTWSSIGPRLLWITFDGDGGRLLVDRISVPGPVLDNPVFRSGAVEVPVLHGSVKIVEDDQVLDTGHLLVLARLTLGPGEAAQVQGLATLAGEIEGGDLILTALGGRVFVECPACGFGRLEAGHFVPMTAGDTIAFDPGGRILLENDGSTDLVLVLTLLDPIPDQGACVGGCRDLGI
jgi:hypothetical protein